MNVIPDYLFDKNNHHPQILLVEDEDIVAKGLNIFLTEEGYDVDVAITGTDAIARFRSNGFDLVVVDLYLPDMNGIDVIRKIKGDREETRVVIITGCPSTSSAVEASKIGVTEYLPKPFTVDEFLATINKALKETESTRKKNTNLKNLSGVLH